MRYTPFGEIRLITGSVPRDRRYTGQRQESVGLGGLYDYGARFYSPALGRFLSADTIVPGAGNPQAFNRYAYSLNNPVKYIDPSGHDVDCSPWKSVCKRRVAYEKAWALQNKYTDTNTTWNQLAPEEQEILSAVGWYDTWWNAEMVTGSARDVGGTLEDPVTYVELALGARAAIKLGQLGWEAIKGLGSSAAAACAASEACRNEIGSIGGRVIHFMEHQVPRVQKIMADKHLWDRLTTLGPDLMQNYRAIQPYIQQAINSGTARQINTSSLGKVMEYGLSVNGQQVVVRAIELTNGVIQITDAWVKKP